MGYKKKQDKSTGFPVIYYNFYYILLNFFRWKSEKEEYYFDFFKEDLLELGYEL